MPAPISRATMRGIVRTILIVDDQASFRSLARSMLEADGYLVVGEAADGATAIARARSLKPDLVLLDVQLPDLDGFAVCEQLALGPDPPPIVLTSTRPVSSYRHRLRMSGARGFIAKSELTGSALAEIIEPV
jgi:two-component system nitrate/nitrite response regulator NarL